MMKERSGRHKNSRKTSSSFYKILCMARFCLTKSKSSLAGKNDWADKTKEEFVKVCFDLKCMSYISILRPEIY